MFDDRVLIYRNSGPFGGAYTGFGEQPHQVTYDKSAIFSVKCVIFDLPSLTRLDYHSLSWLHSRKLPGQVWVIYSGESAANYPALAQPEFTCMFDLEMSYRLCADIWTPYFNATTLANARSARVLPKRHFAAAFISSDSNKSGRLEYLKELMDYIPVHSYGTLLNNHSEASVDHNDLTAGLDPKLGISAHYRFSLAFENSISPDYVTEKFYQPLMVGSIPVYLGATNVAEFSPSPECYVNVNDFKGPKALAAHLLALDDRDYHRWRQHSDSIAFADKLDRLARQGITFDALCRQVSAMQVRDAHGDFQKTHA